MRNYLYILFLLIGFTSCNDGDIIINNFDFADAILKSCNKTGKVKVLYIINNNDVFETISLRVSNTGFSEQAGVLSVKTDGNIRISLPSSNGSNDAKLIYRTYDGMVPTDYFCRDIPPSTPKVAQEFLSVGGTVVIVTSRNLENVTDRDGDGIDDVDELNEDTDGDGIMNIDDTDDDGDNVPTLSEITNANDDPLVNGLRDTDGDGIPNYLDNDDDGDGTPTKLEVTEGSTNPIDPKNANEDGLANYLNPLINNRFTGTIEILPNKISVNYRSIITIENLQLQNQDGSGEVISFETYELGDFISSSTDIIIPQTTVETDN